MENNFTIIPVEHRLQTFHNCKNKQMCRAVLFNPSTKQNEKWEGTFAITPRTGKSKWGEEMIFQFKPYKLLSTELPNGNNRTFEFYEGLDNSIEHLETILKYLKEKKNE